MELAIAGICFEMKQTGFPLDIEECNKQISQLNERIDWVDSVVMPFIPPKPKAYGVTVSKVFKMNGEPTKMVTDWFKEDSHMVVGEFTRITFEPINLGSAPQVKAWLLKNGWQPQEWNYKKDARGKEIKDREGNKIKSSPKITADSLDDLEELGQAGRLISYREKVKHRRNQLKGFLKNCRTDGRVPSVVNTLGAETRRMTHSVIVNVPNPNKKKQFWPIVRKVFYSGSSNYVVVGADASQIQIRGLVHYAAALGDWSGVETFRKIDAGEAKDFHEVNGETAGVSRQDSKGLFYGYIFGAGIPKTAKQLGRTEKETKAIRAKFDKAVPYFKKVVDHLVKFYRKYGYITGLDGVKIFVESEHMLLCYLLQNFEAVLVKHALIVAYRKIKEESLDAKVVTFQHDEFQFICHKDHANRLKEVLEESMIEAGTIVGSNCPILGEAKIGLTWYDTH